MVPVGLAEELRQFHNQRIFVPPEVDRSVLKRAERRFRRIRARKPWTLWSAIAACIALGLATFWTLDPGRPAPQQELNSSPLTQEDVDGNGSVNVLDAFALARWIKSGDSLQPRLDMNRDGLIDTQDIDHVAFKAVRLEEGNL